MVVKGCLDVVCVVKGVGVERRMKKYTRKWYYRRGRLLRVKEWEKLGEGVVMLTVVMKMGD